MDQTTKDGYHYTVVDPGDGDVGYWKERYHALDAANAHDAIHEACEAVGAALRDAIDTSAGAVDVDLSVERWRDHRCLEAYEASVRFPPEPDFMATQEPGSKPLPSPGG